MSRYTRARVAQGVPSITELMDLDREALQRRVYSMANAGFGEHTIADFLKLHVDQVRTILSERPK